MAGVTCFFNKCALQNADSGGKRLWHVASRVSRESRRDGPPKSLMVQVRDRGQWPMEQLSYWGQKHRASENYLILSSTQIVSSNHATPSKFCWHSRSKKKSHKWEYLASPERSRNAALFGRTDDNEDILWMEERRNGARQGAPICDVSSVRFDAFQLC